MYLESMKGSFRDLLQEGKRAFSCPNLDLFSRRSARVEVDSLGFANSLKFSEMTGAKLQLILAKALQSEAKYCLSVVPKFLNLLLTPPWVVRTTTFEYLTRPRTI